MGWGKLNWKCEISNNFFFWAAKSPTAINMCLDEMEEFKRMFFFPFSNKTVKGILAG